MSNYVRVNEYRDNPNYRGYHDHGPSINELTEQIKNNIFKVNSGANSLERSMRHIGTEEDSLQLRDKIHETSQNTNKIVQSTLRLLHSVAEKRADKHQKVQIDLLKSQFQDSVQRFYILQKKAAERGKTAAVRLLSIKHLISLDVATDQRTVTKENRRRASILKNQVQFVGNDLAFIHEVEERIHQLESDILDVNSIFRDLGALVQAQGEIMDYTDSNIEQISENVDSGTQELIKAIDYQRKSIQKMCTLVIIVVVIAIIFTIIIVVRLKK